MIRIAAMLCLLAACTATAQLPFAVQQTLFFASRASATNYAPPITNGLVLWYDAADSSTLVKSGQYITQWSDKSGYGNHATAATSYAPSNGTFHGRSVVQCYGTNYMLLTTPITPATSTVFVVAYKTLQADAGVVFWGGDSVPYLTLAGEVNGIGVGYSTIGAAACYSPSTDFGKLTVITLRVNPGTTANLTYWTGTTSGTAVNVNPSADSTTWKRLFHYGWQPASLKGGISTLLYYNRPLADGELSTMQAWLKNNYGE